MSTPTTTAVPVSHLIHAKGIQWHQPADGQLSINSRNVDIKSQVQQLVRDIRGDIMRLRQCHEILMGSKYFANDYRDKYAQASDNYQSILEQLKALQAQPASQEVLDALQDIDDKLALNKASVDLLFTQVAYRAGFIHFLMSSVVADIGFEDLKSEATIALKELGVLSGELYQQSSTNDQQLLPAQTALQVFVIFDELCRYEERIKELKRENDHRATMTNSRVLGVTLAFFAIILISTGLMAYYKDSWTTIQRYSIIGVPLGVFLWSLIGSFAAMISQYYKNTVYQFGNTFKWVFVRPVLGVLMAAGIYLALYTLVIDERTTNSELLPLLVAFFVGYSDSFSLDLMGSIQNVITSLFSSKAPAASMTADATPVVPATPVIGQPMAVTPPIVSVPATKAVDPLTNPNNIPPHPGDATPLPLKPNGDDFSGEDET